MEYKSYHFPFVNIVVEGNGGTGAYVVAQLARLIYSLRDKKTIDLTLVDGDTVERKNLLRQHFIESDLGKNKARVLSERYSKAFGIPIRYVDRFITGSEQLQKIFSGMGNSSFNILIGCVDNTQARIYMDKYFNSQDHLIYIDSGNDEVDGQIVMGEKRHGKLYSPPVGQVYPQILEPEVVKPVSCADHIGESPQNIMANFFAAAGILALLNNILAFEECDATNIMFDCKSIFMRSIN